MDDINAKGKILAVEWIFNESSQECTSFAVGYAEGHLEIYKAETKSQKPIKLLNFDQSNLNTMQIYYNERGSDSNAFLSIFYSQKDSMYAESESHISNSEAVNVAGSGQIADSQTFDKTKVFTSVTIFTGKKLDQRIDLHQFITQEPGHEEMVELKANCGVLQTFMLNQILTDQQFLASLNGDYINKSAKKVTAKNLPWAKLYEVMRTR